MLFTSTDVKQMGDKLNPKIREACKYMDEAREWIGPNMKELPSLTQRLIGTLDVRLVFHVMGLEKKIKTRRTFNSLLEIAQQFALDVQLNGGTMHNCPWKLPAAESAPRTPSCRPLEHADRTPLKFGEDGSLDICQLKDVFGMELGETVALKKGSSSNVRHIASIEGQTVTLQGADDTTTVTAGELVDLYKVVKVEPDILVRSTQFRNIQALTRTTVEAIGVYAKAVLAHAYQLQFPKTCVDAKFGRGGKDKFVFAGAKYPTSGLKLVPYSPNLYNVASEGNEKVPNCAHIQLKFRAKELGVSQPPWRLHQAQSAIQSPATATSSLSPSGWCGPPATETKQTCTVRP